MRIFIEQQQQQQQQQQRQQQLYLKLLIIHVKKPTKHLNYTLTLRKRCTEISSILYSQKFCRIIWV